MGDKLCLGNHTDPYGYLSQMGVSKEKLAYDLAHGFTDENPTTSDDKPVIDPTEQVQQSYADRWNKLRPH